MVRTSSGAGELTLLSDGGGAVPCDFAQHVRGVQRLQVRVTLAAVIVDLERLVIVVVFEE